MGEEGGLCWLEKVHFRARNGFTGYVVDTASVYVNRTGIHEEVLDVKLSSRVIFPGHVGPWAGHKKLFKDQKNAQRSERWATRETELSNWSGGMTNHPWKSGQPFRLSVFL
jgi:hypothetical protein